MYNSYTLTAMVANMTKKELEKRKNALAYQIRNIRADYVHVLRDDLPQEVIDEVNTLMAEMKEVRELLGKEQ